MRGPLIDRRWLLAAGAGLVVPWPALAAPAVETVQTADGRTTSVWVWSPRGAPKGVIHFSHGALSAPMKYTLLIEPWVAAGFAVFAPLHVDSTDHPDHAKYHNLESWGCRLFDMRAVAELSKAPTYIAAGHSYGALTAVVLGGVEAVTPPGWQGPMRDSRATSVVAFSPPGPNPILDPLEGFGHLAVPSLIETGDLDVVPVAMGGNGDWHPHLTAYVEAPPGDKYALIIDGVDHYFGHLICSPERQVPAQIIGLAAGIAVSTEFLLAFGAGDAKSRAQLDGPVPPESGYTLTRK